MRFPVDPVEPPAEPPAGTAQPMLWRLARRLYHDHSPVTARDQPPPHVTPPPVYPDDDRPICRTCGARWPCRGRRIAERGLHVAAGSAGRHEAGRWPDPD